MKRIFTTLAVCTFAAASLAGCGSGGSDTTAASPTAESATTAAEAATQSPGTAPTTDATTDATTEASPAAQTYTMAQVAEHNNATSCWTAINKEVYDVTGWISAHPGGPDKIEGLCGKDGTSMFEGQHSGQGEPNDRLSSFKIGALQG